MDWLNYTASLVHKQQSQPGAVSIRKVLCPKPSISTKEPATTPFRWSFSASLIPRCGYRGSRSWRFLCRKPGAVKGVFFTKPGLEQDIALHALPTARNIYLIQAFPAHSTYFSQILFKHANCVLSCWFCSWNFLKSVVFISMSSTRR